jgi:hypothetical protein
VRPGGSWVLDLLITKAVKTHALMHEGTALIAEVTARRGYPDDRDRLRPTCLVWLPGQLVRLTDVRDRPADEANPRRNSKGGMGVPPKNFQNFRV